MSAKGSVGSLKDTDSTTVEHAKEMGLDDAEYARAIEVLGRVPNKVELGCFSAMWSEHCSYKSSRVHLRKLPTTGKHVLIGPGENAGVVDAGEGWAVAFKVESHNHPSYIEPYQGAATGVGGILRDVFTMGARPIAAMNVLRFGRPSHEKTPHLLSGVVRGIGGYGNCFGVPTVYSHTDFDAAYDGNILVNAFALGVMKKDAIFLGRAEGVGNPVIYVGAKTGRDGIHGATMASDSFSEGEEQERPTVQVGDPFKEKLLMEACQEVFQTDHLVGIQDMGAAGLTSSSFEMASRTGAGVRIDLDCVPARETHMTAYELMLSESQERMLLVAKKGREDAVTRIFTKWGLDCTVIGAVTNDGFVRLVKDGAEVGVLPARELADEAPRYERPYARASAPAPLDVSRVTSRSVGEVARALVLSAPLASKRWIYRQYDREVGAGTFFDGTQAAAALVRLPGTQRALAMALVCDERWCAADAREGARRAVAEGVLRIACVGATPLGATDCLNFGDPKKPDIMAQLVDGIEGIAEACTALDAPVVSGNVSLYNQTDDRAVHPTPTVGVVGLVEDATRVAPRAPPSEGDAIVLLGALSASLHGSLALVLAHDGKIGGGLGAWDLERVKRLAHATRNLVLHGIVKEARPVVQGGLVGALGEIARAHGVGLFAALPAGVDAHAAWFGEERAGVVLVVPAARLNDVAAHTEGLPMEVLGAIGGSVLALGDVKLPLAELLQADGDVVPAIARGEAEGAIG
jgi:phosphoribosylformylglycinamidine synthase subunit PurL